MHNKILLFKIYSHFACPTQTHMYTYAYVHWILKQETHASHRDKTAPMREKAKKKNKQTNEMTKK